MNSTKLTPAVLFIPLALATLACPTRPLDRDAGSGGTGGEAGAATGGTGGQAGAAAGEAGGGGSGTGGLATGGAAGSIAGAAGGVAGSAAGTAGGAAGSLAGAGGGIAGAAGGTTGAQGGTGGAAAGASGATGGSTGLGGTTGTGGALEDGQPCSLATNCASHVCTAFYADVDGDGYGAGQAIGFCGTTAPIGYAAQSGDCCDSATNLTVAKLIHPGADYQTASAGGVCGITWDYDCSGEIEQTLPNQLGCTAYPDCANTPTPYPESYCGQPVTTELCRRDDTAAMCHTVTGLSGTERCK